MQINPFDILSGKIVQNEWGTFYFKEAGNNIDCNRNYNIKERNLHRDNDLPAAIYKNGYSEWWIDGKRHRVGSPAAIYKDGSKGWWLNGKRSTEEEYNKAVINL